jgi:hypothetical protein
MITAVDWLDRYVVLRIEDKEKKPTDFPLNLMLFDFIIRSSKGFVAEKFFAHDIRRIMNFLGKIAERSNGSNDRILLFLDGKTHNLSIDEGVIQVGGGN